MSKQIWIFFKALRLEPLIHACVDYNKGNSNPLSGFEQVRTYDCILENIKGIPNSPGYLVCLDRKKVHHIVERTKEVIKSF